MKSESSVIARRLNDYFDIQNEKENPGKLESGIFKSVLLISLMAVSVFLTQVTLFLVRWVKRLEG